MAAEEKDALLHFFPLTRCAQTSSKKWASFSPAAHTSNEPASKLSPPDTTIPPPPETGTHPPTPRQTQAAPPPLAYFNSGLVLILLFPWFYDLDNFNRFCSIRLL
ncbi:hypothetical protein KTH81_13330 [Lachnospiraceae bacterium ASD3451]|uniref:hypothetical protein n=1 Tax=Diplocloster agilis TaxID=2850323 RepID=UPI001D26FBA7|nr:hypothetical protein [Diplocloster agilis]MBU9744809.1 hypothetical protein [Diplocloster agilis]